MNVRALLVGAGLLFLAAVPALADEVNLPGHALSTKDATAQARTVFLGQVVSLDPVKVNAGRGEYRARVIYVSHPGNGMAPYSTSQMSDPNIPAIPSDLGIPVTMTVGANESAPVVGKEYVFYAKDNTRPGRSGYEALKLSPTSEYGMGVRSF
jgi:hypothetical protein